jgi:hypothetical protein
MSGKSAKKFRKAVRNSVQKFAKGVIGRGIFKVARQRDMIFLVAIGELILIIILIMVMLSKGI